MVMREQSNAADVELSEREIAYIAWLGAVLDRLERGIHPPISFDESEFNADVQVFGVTNHNPTPRDFDLRPRVHPAVDRILLAIHGAVANESWEAQFWECLPLLFTPPDEIVADLVRRDIAVEALGHCRLHDAMLWSLAGRVDEALLTLAKRRYVHDEYTADDFEEVLHAYSSHEWMLGSLSGLPASDDEKINRLIRYIAAHPDSEKLVRHQTPEFAAVWSANNGNPIE